MPDVISLKGGKNETLFNFNDFLWLVDSYMGLDAKRYLEAHVDELQQAADYTTAKVGTDLNSYEASLESNTRAFQEIEERCRGMIKNFNDEQGRNRLLTLRPWRNEVDEILKIISNQI